MHSTDPYTVPRQWQVMTGTILGGSSVVKQAGARNCYLSMRSKDPRWLRWKAAQLENLASRNAFTSDTTHRWHSTCYPLFNRLRESFYAGGKRCLKMESLDSMSDVAFAVWFGDAGSYRNGRVVLNTNVWGQEGTDIVLRYFEAIDYVSAAFQERGCHRVRLDRDSSADFLKLATPHLPMWFIEESIGDK